MAQLIRPGSVKVRSQDGEVQVTIALELTINLNTEGLSLTAAPLQAQQQSTLESSKEKNKKNDVMFEIPDFGASPKVDFGKKQ